MRQGEIAGLRWQSIDFRGRNIHVCEAIAQSSDGGTYSKDPKTNQDRYIPLASGLEDVLVHWKDECTREWASEHGGDVAAFDHSYVVGHPNGRHPNPHTLSKDWTTISSLYGLKGTQGKRVTFHD